MGINPGNGKLLWTFPHPNEWSVHPNTPIYYEGGLLFFSGYGKGSAKLELNSDGSKASIAWRNQSLDSRMGGAVLLDGYLYGSGDRHRAWKCLDWETGDTTWTSTALAKGNVIYADGMLYCYTERGELALVKADPGKFNLVSLTRVAKGSGQHWAHPMIHRGVLYLRHGNALITYKIK
jgi:outer membrane protein assembly factor BamB